MGRGFESHRGHEKESQMTCNEPFGFFVVPTVGSPCGANANFTNSLIDSLDSQRHDNYPRKDYSSVMRLKKLPHVRNLTTCKFYEPPVFENKKVNHGYWF